jgi:hypothetical protein
LTPAGVDVLLATCRLVAKSAMPLPREDREAIAEQLISLAGDLTPEAHASVQKLANRTTIDTTPPTLRTGQAPRS